MLSKRILIVLALAFLTLLVGCLTPTNQTPILTSDPITVATVGVAYTYNVDATDPDGDTLTYSFIDKPEGMVINSTTGVINWIPSFGQIGDNPVVVKVSDGTSSIAQSFIIEVSKFPVNQAPIIYSVPVTTATVGVTYVYDVEATDPDGDTLIYSLTTKPAGMTINSVTGLIWWIPYPTQVGNHLVTVKVSDGSLSITQGFTITVSKPTPTPINQAPVIYSTPITTATVGVTYVYDVNATDPDNDVLAYSLTTKPPGMVINPANGLISWIPTSVQTGYNWVVIVSVSDGALSDFQGFNIVVSELPAVNHFPEITSIPGATAIVGVEYIYDVEATDPDGDTLTYSLITKPDGMEIDPGTGVISWTPTEVQIGVGNFTVKVSDGQLSDTQTFGIIVKSNKITIRWLEDAIRYNADCSFHSGWFDCHIPSLDQQTPAPNPATLILTDGEYHFADIQEYFNWDMEYEGDVVIAETGQLSGWATYSLYGLSTENSFAGQVEIIIYEEGDAFFGGDNDGTMVGTYTQFKYAYAEGVEELEILNSKYPNAVECVDEGKWFVQYTDYIAHGEVPTT